MKETAVESGTDVLMGWTKLIRKSGKAEKLIRIDTLMDQFEKVN